MKNFLAILLVPLLFLTGCGKKIEGSYKWTGTVLGVRIQNIYDFNADGTVVWTTGSPNERQRGTYTVNGNRVLLSLKDRQVELVREGDALMRGTDRFVRE